MVGLGRVELPTRSYSNGRSRTRSYVLSDAAVPHIFVLKARGRKCTTATDRCGPVIVPTMRFHVDF
jgi:hypothetical protein